MSKQELKKEYIKLRVYFNKNCSKLFKSDYSEYLRLMVEIDLLEKRINVE